MSTSSLKYCVCATRDPRNCPVHQPPNETVVQKSSRERMEKELRQSAAGTYQQARSVNKQAGDVKRYDWDYADSGSSERTMVQEHDGDWVRYDDIAHLLKPQEQTLEALNKDVAK